MKIKCDFPKSMGCSKSNSKREVQSNAGLPQETRKITNKEHNLSSKGIRKRKTNNSRSQEKEGNNKDHRENKQNRDQKKQKTKNNIEPNYGSKRPIILKL